MNRFPFKCICDLFDSDPSLQNPVLPCPSVSLFDTYYYFSSGVPLFQILDRGRDLTQLVTPVDDRCQLSGLHEISQDGQVLLVQLRQKGRKRLVNNGDNIIALSITDTPPSQRPSLGAPIK